MKELVLGYSNICHPGSIFPFDDVFQHSMAIFTTNRSLVPSLEKKVDAVVFWGGTDIHPSIYNKKKHPSSQAGDKLSNRDVDELKAMTYCKMHGIPMIGVCRGAQLACAFAGGTLIQHCDGHHGDHYITVEYEKQFAKTILSTSDHHQMMNPEGTDHKLLAWTDRCRATFLDGEDEKEQIYMEKEPEIVYFRSTKTLAFQGHPEWVSDALDPYAQLCNQLIRQFLLEPEAVAA